MSENESLLEVSGDPLFAAIEGVVLSLPHAHELAKLDVSETPSSAVIQSGNILPFRRNQLRPEEWQKLMDVLAD